MRPLLQRASLVGRLARLSAATLLLLAAISAFSMAAEAAPPATIVGSAPAVAHGAGTVTFSYTIVLPSAVDSTVLTTHQPIQLPAQTGGVTLDGVAVPVGQVTRPSAVDIAIQTGPNPVDGLAAGSHTITFSTALGSGPAADTASSATLSWSVAASAGSVTSSVVSVKVNQPDLAVLLTPDTGEDQVGLLGTGRELILEVDVQNLGYGTPASTLHIALPTGVAIGPGGVSRDANGAALTCVADAVVAGQLNCPLGALTHQVAGADPTYNISLTTTAAQPIGQTVPITVSATPDAGQGTDTDPTNDSATARLQLTGAAKLSYTISPASSKVVLGATTTVKLTVHNAGPQPAPGTLALSFVVGTNFDIVGFTGKTPDLSGGAGSGASTTSHRASVTSTGAGLGPADPTGTIIVWLIGDLPAGQSATATLTLRAHKIGPAKIGLLAFSGAADPNCPDLDCAPASATLQIIAAPAVIKPAAPTPSPAAAAPALAATGQNPAPTAGLASGLLLAGLGLLLLTRRRRTS